LGACSALGKHRQAVLFLKKEKKAFVSATTALRSLHRPCAAPVAEVFAFFFKKKHFLPFPAKD
jgi:hypothetical protein